MQTPKLFGFQHHGQRDPWQGAPAWAIELGWSNHAILQGQQAIMAALKQEQISMSQMDDEIAQLAADVAAEKGAVDSAVALIGGFAAKLDAAVAAAKASGATDDQLKAITDMSAAVKAQTNDLSTAITANP